MLKAFDMPGREPKGSVLSSAPPRLGNSEFDAAADRRADVLHTVALEQLEQAAVDPFDRAGAFVDPAGVDLHGARAGANLVVGVLGGENPADADNRQSAARRPINMRDEMGHEGGDRPPAEPA